MVEESRSDCAHADSKSHSTCPQREGPLCLNVGGRLFHVGPQIAAKSALLRRSLHNNNNNPPSSVTDGSGNLFIDGDPDEFAEVLEYLRTGELQLLDARTLATVMASPGQVAGRTRTRLLKFRKCFGYYGISPPELCKNCHSLFNPHMNTTDACVRHTGVLDGATFTCCGLSWDSLGCETASHVSQPAAPRAVWRVNPEEGSRVPLVVEESSGGPPPGTTNGWKSRRRHSEAGTPFDLVCRPGEYSPTREDEVVNLACDVDIESMDFPSKTSSARATQSPACPSEAEAGPCWLYSLQPAASSAKRASTRSVKCAYFQNKECSRGGACQYLHADDTAQQPALIGIRKKNFITSNKPPNPKYKTRMCPQYRAGGCPRSSSECKFAHGLEELRGTREFFKTQICSFWSAGFCRAGARCRHAHGPEELRSTATAVVPETAAADPPAPSSSSVPAWPSFPIVSVPPEQKPPVTVVPVQAFSGTWPQFTAPPPNCRIVWLHTRSTDVTTLPPPQGAPQDYLPPSTP